MPGFLHKNRFEARNGLTSFAISHINTGFGIELVGVTFGQACCRRRCAISAHFIVVISCVAKFEFVVTTDVDERIFVIAVVGGKKVVVQQLVVAEQVIIAFGAGTIRRGRRGIKFGFRRKSLHQLARKILVAASAVDASHGLGHSSQFYRTIQLNIH